jgi:hypothetical protein
LKTEADNATDFAELLKRYAPVRLQVERSELQPGDELALTELTQAAQWTDEIYWKQRAGEEWLKRFRAQNSNSEAGDALSRLLKINFGPWDTFDNDAPFLAVPPRPPGGCFYPSDLSREEFEQYLTTHPEQRQSLLSHTTLVRRHGALLEATPYEVAYREELENIAAHLERASAGITSHAFRDFLIARAKGLMTGELYQSERLWMAASSSPIDIAIGPYEVYDDGLLGVKASYEATVMVRHRMTEELAHFESMTPELERRLPGSVEPVESRRRFELGVYDVVFTAGMTNMGGKAIAATLPNDETIRSEVGARLLLFRNVIAAKFTPILKPIGERILRTDHFQLVREDVFLYHTLLHEMAHALSTCYVRRPHRGNPITINEALRERYSAIEECRADLLGMVFLNLLADRGLLPPAIKAAALVTFVVNNVRSLRFGAGDDYSRGAAVVLSTLFRGGSIRAERDGRLSIEPQKAEADIKSLAATLQGIATEGDYAGAGKLIEDLGSIPIEIDRMRGALAEIPIDLEFLQADPT